MTFLRCTRAFIYMGWHIILDLMLGKSFMDPHRGSARRMLYLAQRSSVRSSENQVSTLVSARSKCKRLPSVKRRGAPCLSQSSYFVSRPLALELARSNQLLARQPGPPVCRTGGPWRPKWGKSTFAIFGRMG